MAYTICDKWGDCTPLRVIVPNVHGVPELKAEFKPAWWVCDPYRSERRFEVTHRNDQEPQYLAWYQVVTSDDTPEDVAVKLEHYKRVIAAGRAMDAAAQEYRRLTECGWSCMP
jgi:hypothetical protein